MTHPQQALYLLLFAGAYSGLRCWAAGRPGDGAAGRLRQAWRRLLPVGLGVTGGVILALNFFHVNLTWIADSNRQPIAFRDLPRETGQLPARYLLTLVFPDFFGNPAGKVCFTPALRPPQPYNNYNELCLYVGVVTLVFAVLALAVRPRDRRVLGYAGCTVFVLLCAAGSVLYYPIARWVPGMGVCTPTRMLFLSSTAGCRSSASARRCWT